LLRRPLLKDSHNSVANRFFKLFMPFVVLACIYLAFSFGSFRRTTHLVWHGVVTEGHLIVDGKVRFITLQGITLEFHSQAAPDRVGTVVPVLYDPIRPSICHFTNNSAAVRSITLPPTRLTA
jgi:hypothetical protein